MSSGSSSLPAGWEEANQQDRLVECIQLFRDTLPFYYENMTLVHCVRNINAGCLTVWRRWTTSPRMALAFHLRRDPVGASGTPVLHYVSIGVEATYDPAVACNELVAAGQVFQQASNLKLCYLRQAELDLAASRLGALLAEAASRPGLLGPEISRPRVAPWPAGLERELNP
mgnify:CR=1 FL=1